MKKGWKRPLVAGVLTASMLAALPVISMADNIDLDKSCSMTIAAIGASAEEDVKADLEGANVVLDVYKVASATAVEGYDTYAYSMEAAYSSFADRVADTSSMTNDDWRSLANDVATTTLTSGQTFAKAADGVAAGTQIPDLGAGLYLVIARSADLEDYVDTVIDEEGNETLVTLAQSDKWVYTYAPELISLPTKVDEEGNRSTDIAGDWIYDVTDAAMKPERTERYGTLEITKTLSRKEASSDVTFVFSITAVDKKGNTVYDDVAGITFDGTGTKTVTISDKIPAGATVTVTEVYSGASYTLTSVGSSDPAAQILDAGAIVTIPSGDSSVSVTFSNDYDGKLVPGSGIVNKLGYREDANGNPYLDILDNTSDNTTDANAN